MFAASGPGFPEGEPSELVSDHAVSVSVAVWGGLERPPTLQFSEEGEVRIFDGCVNRSGHFHLDGPQLSLFEMQTVGEPECPVPFACRISEHYVTLFHDGTLVYTIDANQLRIERGTDGMLGHTD